MKTKMEDNISQLYKNSKKNIRKTFSQISKDFL